MKANIIAAIAGMSALLMPAISYAQDTDIFKKAQQKFAEEREVQKAWSESSRTMQKASDEMVAASHDLAKFAIALDIMKAVRKNYQDKADEAVNKCIVKSTTSI
jgi:hypothetical protein